MLKINSFKLVLTIFVALSTFHTALADSPSRRSVKRAHKNSFEHSYEPREESYEKWELRTAPLMLPFSWYILDVSYRFSPHWAFGPSVVIYNQSDAGFLHSSRTGYAVGLNGNYYFQPVTRHGLYLGAHMYYDSHQSGLDDRLAVRATESVGFRGDANLGYRLSWKPFTMAFGIGPEYRSYVKRTIGGAYFPDETESKLFLNIEAKLGFQF